MIKYFCDECGRQLNDEYEYKECKICMYQKYKNMPGAGYDCKKEIRVCKECFEIIKTDLGKVGDIMKNNKN